MECDAGPTGEVAELPESVRAILVDLQAAVVASNLKELERLYMQELRRFPGLYNKMGQWPHVLLVETFYRQLGVDYLLTTTLYAEVYYRCMPLHNDMNSEWLERSYNTYMTLFDALVPEKGMPTPVMLPPQWIWDIMDNFMDHYEKIQRRRWTLLGPTANEENPLASNSSSLWTTPLILNVLSRLVYQSQVKTVLRGQWRILCSMAVTTWLSHSDSVAAECEAIPSCSELLGFYSVILLIRFYVSIGDYRAASRITEQNPCNTERLDMLVFSCHLQFMYYIGVAYLMTRRYSAALCTVLSPLTALSTQSCQDCSESYSEKIVCWIDRIYFLILLLMALYPTQSIHPCVVQHIQQRWPDVYYQLQCWDMEEYKAVFAKACPIFLPVAVTLNNTSTLHSPDDVDLSEPFRRQLNVFLRHVAQRACITRLTATTLASQNVTLSKLARLLGMNDDRESIDEVQAQLLMTKALINEEPSVLPALSKERIHVPFCGDIYIKLDTIYVVHGIDSYSVTTDRLLKQIKYTQEALHDITKLD